MNCRAGLEVNVLVQQTEFDSARTHDVTPVRRFIASDETKDRALTGAVAAHKSDVLTRIYLQRCASQDVLNAVRFVDIGKSEQHRKHSGTENRSRGYFPAPASYSAFTVFIYFGDAAGFTETGELVDAGPVPVEAAGLAAGACVGACAGCDPVAFAEAGRKPRLPGLLSISVAR